LYLSFTVLTLFNFYQSILMHLIRTHNVHFSKKIVLIDFLVASYIMYAKNSEVRSRVLHLSFTISTLFKFYYLILMHLIKAHNVHFSKKVTDAFYICYRMDDVICCSTWKHSLSFPYSGKRRENRVSYGNVLPSYYYTFNHRDLRNTVWAKPIMPCYVLGGIDWPIIPII